MASSREFYKKKKSSCDAGILKQLLVLVGLLVGLLVGFTCNQTIKINIVSSLMMFADDLNVYGDDYVLMRQEGDEKIDMIFLKSERQTH